MGNGSSRRLEQARTIISIYEAFVQEARGFASGAVNRAYEEVRAVQTDEYKCLCFNF